MWTQISLYCNSPIGRINKCVTLLKARKACHGQALQLIGPNHKLQRKNSFFENGPDVFFTVTYKWAQ
jgi:hypothetical protein